MKFLLLDLNHFLGRGEVPSGGSTPRTHSRDKSELPAPPLTELPHQRPVFRSGRLGKSEAASPCARPCCCRHRNRQAPKCLWIQHRRMAPVGKKKVKFKL